MTRKEFWLRVQVDESFNCVQISRCMLAGFSPLSQFVHVLALWIVALSATAGDVVINEFMAASSARLLHRDSNGVPRLGTGPAWYEPEFAPTEWSTGRGPFGFGRTGLGTDVGTTMRSATPSLYIRREFAVTPGLAADTNRLQLRINYDDGFVAYLNGVEIARKNLGPTHSFVYADQPSFNKRTVVTNEVIVLPAASALLRPGLNVLAFQVHNTWPVSFWEAFDPTLLLDASLELSSDPATSLVQPADEHHFFIGLNEPSGGVFDPSLLRDPAGGRGFSDWIELYNRGAERVSLAGWSLTDDPALPAKWVFPDVVLEPSHYLVVLCSGLDRRTLTQPYMHTNFELDKAGEYLGLFDAAGRPSSEFRQEYPPQAPCHSYGRDPLSGSYVYLQTPTPGRPNIGPTFTVFVEVPDFSPSGGFHDGPVTLVLRSATLGATIRYTQDGTEPSETEGLDYTGPIAIQTNAAIRARAFRPGWIPSASATATYLINQPAALKNMTAVVVTGDPQRSLFNPEGITAIGGGWFSTNLDWMFPVWQPLTSDDYNRVILHGQAFEKPVSMELLDPNEGSLAQIDCGLRVAGSLYSRLRMRMDGLESGMWKWGWTNKPSMSFFFRPDYGSDRFEMPLFPESRVSSFESLRLRAGKNDAINPFIRDATVRRLFLNMGQIGSHSRPCNLYINGQYKTYVGLAERYRGGFFQEWHDSTNEWDVFNGPELEEGTAVQRAADLKFLCINDLTSPSIYLEAARRFDVLNIADYLLLNIYAATDDWPDNNFYLARERAASGIWRLYPWDAEASFGIFTSKAADYNTISSDLTMALPLPSALSGQQVIPAIYTALSQNPEFRLLVADRIQKHLFNGGALTPNNVLSNYMRLKTEVESSLDYLWQQPVLTNYLTNWVAERPGYVFQHFRAAGLWPNTPAPVLNLPGGPVNPGVQIAMANPAGPGTIYYTLDGSDPRAAGGSVAGSPYSDPITLFQPTLVRARTLKAGEWSPLMEAWYEFPPPPSLAITEIHYEPLPYNSVDGQLFEFLEIKNTGTNVAHLTGVAFTAGISFNFTNRATLPPGGFAVLVANPAAFLLRYSSVPVWGAFTGRLDNSGERITLAQYGTNVLFSVRYNDHAPWPTAPAGGGFTLVPALSSTTDPNDARYWRASSQAGGSPAADDPDPTILAVRISELLPWPNEGAGWRVELHNPNLVEVDIGGWFLTDDDSVPMKYRWSEGTHISPNGFVTLRQQQISTLPLANQFTLQPAGGRLVLYSADLTTNLTGYAHEVEYDATDRGVALRRLVNSEGTERFPSETVPTWGSPNATPRVGPVVINEIMYQPRPGNDEFIELFNAGTNPVSLFKTDVPNIGWKLSGVDYDFPVGLVLGPQELLVVTSVDPAAFRARYDVPANVRVLGPWAGTLQNDGERLRLQRPEWLTNSTGGQLIYVTVDEVGFRSTTPWPVGAAGQGASLQRVAPSAYGDEPANWQAAGMTPGRANSDRLSPAVGVVVTSPATGFLSRQGDSMNVHAAAWNETGAVQRVKFFANGVTVGKQAAAPFQCVWTNPIAGTYSLSAVAVLDGGLSITSAPVEVQILNTVTLPGAQVVTAPWIMTQPAPISAAEGSPVALSVEASGDLLQYQWGRLGEGQITGATQQALRLQSLTVADTGDYYVIISNPAGFATSTLATVTVILADSDADGLPDAWELRYGLDSANPLDPFLDLDDDGVSNLEEYQRGTDPSRPEWNNAVVISEIMYHPSSERASEEYIELFNRDASAFDLQGWRFTKGIDFTFPPVTIPPGGFWVIAADLAAFTAKYPGVTNVVGGWTGTLRNSDERITLKDAADRTIDSVHYADSGDWAVRRRGPLDYGTRGWEWHAPHDGLGKSLEWVNSQMPNDYGQNWMASIADQGTPGRANSVAQAETAPLILDVSHFPLVPSSSNSVRITAFIEDEATNGLAVTLHYRDHSTTSPPPFLSLALHDDGQHDDGLPGDRLYAAKLPAQANGTVVEFYVAARDAGGLERTWPAPALDENGLPVQAANAQYQVDDASYPGTQPILRLVMTETERVTFENINRSSDAQMNATLVTDDGIQAKLRYNAGLRIRGAASRHAPVPSLRVNLPADHRWEDVTAMNLNVFYAYNQIIGSVLSSEIALPAADVRAAQVRLNGVNHAKAGPPTPTEGSGFGTYALVDVVGSDWANERFPNDPDGNIYFARRPNTDLSYKGTNWQSYAAAGYTKESNSDLNDWSDLIRLTDVLNNTPDLNYVEQVREVLIPEEWIRYFALNIVLGNNESSLAIGIGDDYDLYRGVNDPRFQLVARDWDTILTDATSLPPNTSLFLAANLPAVGRFLKHPEFAPLYYEEILRLLDAVCSPAELGAQIDRFLASYVATATRTSMTNYMVARANGIRAQIPLKLTATHSLPIVNGFARTTNGQVMLWGRANAIETRAVVVGGQLAAWTAWQAAWTNSTVELLPGINRILVQALDRESQVFEETTVDIWFDAGTQTTVSGGTLSADTVWYPSNSPYRITAPLTVPVGTRLTIEAGTTVFLEDSVSLTVEGRLVARGTPTNQIRFARRPGSSALWNGIRIINSTNESRIRYVVFENLRSRPLDVLNSRALIEGVSFVVPHTCLFFTNSSILVRGCRFPVMYGYEAAIGWDMPTNGYVIFDGNRFEGTSGYCDMIDFTGGRRPGPILQILNNVFVNGSDDALDLDGTDAHVEGNVFMHMHRDAPRESISCGIATDSDAQIVAVRNLFYDCDNGVLLKRGAFLSAVNNTFVRCRETAVEFGSTNRLVLPGRGAILSGNIFWGNSMTFSNDNVPGYSRVDLTVERSILDRTNWPAAGNLNLDPMFVDSTNNFRLRPGSPAIGTGPNGLNMGFDVPAGVSVGSAPPSPTRRRSANLTVGGPGYLNPGIPKLTNYYSYQVNGGAWSEAILMGTTLALTNLTNGSYTIAAVGQNSAGVWQSTNEPTLSRPWIVDSTLPALRLSEVLAWNTNILNHYGTFPDAVELHNTSVNPVDLTGMMLTDDPATPGKYIFPPGITLGGGEHLVLFADEPNGTPGIHLGFSLKREGEGVFLFNSATSGGALIDSVVFGLQAADYSIGRLEDGTWGLNLPTLGASNRAARVASPEGLRINEWLALGLADDFVELHNPLPIPAQMDGVRWTDNLIGWPDRHVMPPLSFVGPLSYQVFWADSDPGKGADHLNFRLAYEQGMIALSHPDFGTIDSVVYGPQRLGVSEGRLSSTSSQSAFFSEPSPGAENRLNQPPQVALTSPDNGQLFSLPGNVPLSASASDADGWIIRVEFYHDSVRIGEVTNSPYSLVWSNAPAGVHSIAARAWDNGGASTDSTPVTISSLPATIQLQSPHDGALVLAGDPINVKAMVTNATASVVRVEFYASGYRVGEDAAAPFEFAWLPGNSGTHSLWAVGVLNGSPSLTSAVVQVRVLRVAFTNLTWIPTNANWKYLDTGVDLGTNWQRRDFDDRSWLEGPAQLGYGEGDEATVVGYGPDPNNKFITTYLRHQFVIESGAAWTNVLVRLLSDDGAMVYLNAEEVVRYNMPDGPVSYLTGAASSTGDEATLQPYPLASSALAPGTNQVAVSVHQVHAQSSDMSFAFELTVRGMTIEPWILAHPSSTTAVAGASATLSAEAAGAPLYYTWHRVGQGPLSGANGPSLTLSNIDESSGGAYSVVVSNSLGTVTSEVAWVTVIIPDTDGDGIPDYWEDQYGLNSEDPDDAFTDLDGDGLDNLGEFRLRTNPNHPDLAIRIAPVGVVGNPSGMQLRFLANSNISYVIEHAASFDSQDWQPLLSIPVHPTNRTVRVETPRSESSRFYRVRTQ